MFYVYVIRNERKETYIGYTTNLEKRLEHHNSDHEGYTNNGNWEYVYYEAYKDEKDAKERESRLKQHGQTKRRLKERIQRSIDS
jgi:putative endonuclease